MSQSKPMLLQVAQTGGLAMLLFGQITGLAAMSADLEPNQPHFHSPSSNLAVTAISISEADANTIETWLIGDINKIYFGIGSVFPSRTEVVLARPNAKVELAKIVVRQDLPPRLRVYAQEMLITANQSADPRLVEVYCQTMQSGVEGHPSYEVWGLPGHGVSSFGMTLVGYGQAALPCLSRLLDNKNELRYGGTGEVRAISGIMHYRVSDLAAYFIAQILHLPYNNTPNLTVRDQYIFALRQQLTSAASNGMIAGLSDSRSQVLQLPLSSLPDKSASVSEADIKTIETWLLGDQRDFIFEIKQAFSERAAIVLSQPKASLELTRIVKREDIPPRLRVYAQQILIKAGQPTNPKLVEVYCQAMQGHEERPFHDIWGVPGGRGTDFSQTLVDYGQAALPCLARLLDNNTELMYVSSEESPIAYVNMHYRVSDLAAYFITQILKLPYDEEPNPAVRDQSIQALRKRLATSLQDESGAQSSLVKPK